MKLAEALSLIHQPPAASTPYRVLLACGFSPLHLGTFLAARLQVSVGQKVEIETGIYGNLADTLDRLSSFPVESATVFIEWADLDARLGYRSLGGWGSRGTAGVIASAKATLSRFANALRNKPALIRVVVSLPTLALPPGFHTVGWQASAAEVALETAVNEFAETIAMLPAVLMVNRQRLGIASAFGERYDFRSDLNVGFPYSVKHADLLAEAVAGLMTLPAPKKGLISDLDDTMWRGIVGEDGPDGVAWDLAGHAQVHGLYQQMLQALAEQGVLIGIASKNDAGTAEKALLRDDFVLKRDKIFPAEIHWNAKSHSVERILKTWNIGADSVVFVDDSKMELEEVRAAQPGIECILFPTNDYAGALLLLQRLRDLFGKPATSDEDALRLNSIRNSQQFMEGAQNNDLAEQFLASTEATISFDWQPATDDSRVLELLNKTNQFNLNGKRFSEAEWHKAISAQGALVVVVSYRDKFGPLGKISVVYGRQQGSELEIFAWVMSCRAFSRRIEHQTLRQLFDRSGAEQIRFAYEETPKNGISREFLKGISENEPVLRLVEFQRKCPALYHHVAFSGKN